jgi:hybrid cluster-associated redox disulfide protein
MVITKDMPLGQVVMEHPETIEVFFRHGLFCLGCAAASFETIEQGALAHGLDVEKLIADLNEAVAGAAAGEAEGSDR